MAPAGPGKMRALVAPKHCKPSEYEVIELPVPTIKEPNEVLVRVHASTLTPGELLFARGQFSLFVKVEFPIRFGLEGSGTVFAIGKNVTAFKPGDAVYGADFRRPALPMVQVGFCSDYVIIPEERLFHKPAHLDFEEVAALFSGTLTAYQSFKLGLELSGTSIENGGTLEGKTVFVPGALSGTGSAGVQLAKNVFGAAKVVSTVSTAKVALLDHYLPDAVDQVVDYQTQDVTKAVGKASVDFVYNTQWSLLGTFPLLKRDKGVVVSIASVPPGSLLREVAGPGNLPFFVGWLADAMQWYYAWKLWGTHVKLGFVSGNMEAEGDTEKVREIIAAGKVKAVMTVVLADNVDKIREECEKVFVGKGGLGKVVIKFA